MTCNTKPGSLVKFNNNILFDDFSDAFGENTPALRSNPRKSKAGGRIFRTDSPSKENAPSKLFKEKFPKSHSPYNSPLKIANKSFVSPNASPSKKSRSLESTETVVNIMPPTPQKKNRRLCPFATRIMEISKRSEHTIQTKDGLANFTLKAKPMGTGTFFNVYEIQSEEPLYSDCRNDQLVVKIFIPEIVIKDNCSIEKYFDHMIKQYNELKATNFPHYAEIKNVETAKVDGFLVVKKIPNSFQIDFDSAAEIDALDEKTKNHLDQIKAAFEAAVRDNICVDYKKDNVGIEYEGTDNPHGDMYLYDYRESEDDLKVFIDLAVQSFSKNEKGECSQAIYDYLMPAAVEQKYRSQVVNGVFKSVDYVFETVKFPLFI